MCEGKLHWGFAVGVVGHTVHRWLFPSHVCTSSLFAAKERSNLRKACMQWRPANFLKPAYHLLFGIDVANGFLVAEILSRYFPQDINMHGFANATSSHYKRDNWNQVIKFCAKQRVGMMYGKDGMMQNRNGESSCQT
eukprot:1145053-Pelagomonas_calceolata.AAC.1